MCLISSVLWVCSHGTLRWPFSILLLYHSQTLGKRYLNRWAIGIKESLQRKHKGWGDGLMWARCGKVGAGVQVGNNWNQRGYGGMKWEQLWTLLLSGKMFLNLSVSVFYWQFEAIPLLLDLNGFMQSPHFPWSYRSSSCNQNEWFLITHLKRILK